MEFGEWMVEVVSGRLDAAEEDFASFFTEELLRSQPASRWAALFRSMRPSFEGASIEQIEVAHDYLARLVVQAGERRHRMSTRTSAGLVSSFSFSPQLPPIHWMDHAVPAVGGSLRVRDYGGEGRPVILFHCGLSDVGQWDWMAEALPGRRIALDLRAHGAWPSEVAFRFDDVAQDVQATLDYFGLVNPTLLGHSLGGYAALFSSSALNVQQLITLDGPNRLKCSLQPVVPPDAPEWVTTGPALVDFDVPRAVDAVSGWTVVLCDTADAHTAERKAFAEFLEAHDVETRWVTSSHAALVGQPGSAADLVSEVLRRTG